MDKRTLKQLLNHYFEDERYEVRTGPAGMNNMTRYIKVQEKNYVLRIYKNHTDIETVAFEHELLIQLQKENKSFQTPCIIKTKENTTYVITNNGEIAVLFMYLSGVNLKLVTCEQYRDYGGVLGELSRCLNTKKLTLKQAYPPYYELNKAYPTCTIETAIVFCENPPEVFKDLSMDLIKVKDYLLSYQTIQNEVKNLPHQLIHGDLNCSNLLMNEEGKINAVLDFEFVTFDLRVMELAICISELLHELDMDIGCNEVLMKKIQIFIHGYLEFESLLPEEIEVLPKLIVLRRVDVFLHFLNRYFQGIETEGMDAINFIKQMVKSMLKQGQWIEKHKSILKESIIKLERT